MTNKYTIVILINLINVFLSVFKDVAIAGYLGTSKAADLFFIAFFIPDMLGSNLMAVAFGVTAVSLLASAYEKEGILETQRVYQKTIGISLKISLGLIVLILGASGFLMNLMGSGLDQESKHLAVLMLVLMSPAIIAYPLVTIRMAMLQVLGRYGKAVFGSVLMNLVILLGVVILNLSQVDRLTGVLGISVIVILALVIEIYYLEKVIQKSLKTEAVLSHQPSARSVEGHHSIEVAFYHKFAPYLILLFLTQSIVYYERYLGSILEQGSVAAVSYANRLAQFPIFVFSYSIAFIALPELSKLINASCFVQAGTLYQTALRRILMLSIPIAIGLSVLCEPIITILFKHNVFDDRSVQLSAAVLVGYGMGVVGQGIILLNIRILTALEKMAIPILLVVSVTLGNMVLDAFLVIHMGISGIGYGAFIGASVMAMLLTGLLLKRLDLSISAEVWFALKVVMANGATILAGIGLKTLWNGYFELQGIPVQIIFGLASGFLLCGISFLSLKCFKSI